VKISDKGYDETGANPHYRAPRSSPLHPVRLERRKLHRCHQKPRPQCSAAGVIKINGEMKKIAKILLAKLLRLAYIHSGRCDLEPTSITTYASR
jgi:hypothetical protein